MLCVFHQTLLRFQDSDIKRKLQWLKYKWLQNTIVNSVLITFQRMIVLPFCQYDSEPAEEMRIILTMCFFVISVVHTQLQIEINWCLVSGLHRARA